MKDNRYGAAIFDLDGTLLDTSPGIFGSVRFAEKSLGLDPIDDELLKEFLGPPPSKMYAKFHGLSEEDALRATKAHRQYGMERAIYEAEVYAEIPGALDTLREAGVKLAVATLKQQRIAEKILKLHDLDRYFEVIIGMNEAESMTKADTIRKAVMLMEQPSAVMIGDSEYDRVGALEAGVDFIGVTYGFGFSPENSYPFMTAETPKDISKLICSCY
ncbi:MAG: HAD-IA family hydrolase [Lachnospiraceae bacterium]|nr:HAD-IA family hydrolase [Lachnospiraceae bacterium]